MVSLERQVLSQLPQLEYCVLLSPYNTPNTAMTSFMRKPVGNADWMSAGIFVVRQYSMGLPIIYTLCKQNSLLDS